jgi:hypothetical protein
MNNAMPTVHEIESADVSFTIEIKKSEITCWLTTAHWEILFDCFERTFNMPLDTDTVLLVQLFFEKAFIESVQRGIDAYRGRLEAGEFPQHAIEDFLGNLTLKRRVGFEPKGFAKSLDSILVNSGLGLWGDGYE